MGQKYMLQPRAIKLKVQKDWINSSTSHSWEFNNNFIDEMVSRYGQEYNFGLPEYLPKVKRLLIPNGY